jgi:hypothetical protein
MRFDPTADELLEIVAEFLRLKVVPALSGQTAFHALVAANTVDIVRREMAQSGSAQAELQTSLQTLLGRDGSLQELNEALCDRITAGEMTMETPGLMAHLKRAIRLQLDIDQPKYGAERAVT